MLKQTPLICMKFDANLVIQTPQVISWHSRGKGWHIPSGRAQHVLLFWCHYSIMSCSLPALSFHLSPPVGEPFPWGLTHEVFPRAMTDWQAATCIDAVRLVLQQLCRAPNTTPLSRFRVMDMLLDNAKHLWCSGRMNFQRHLTFSLTN